jgi:hypothetical protein
VERCGARGTHKVQAMADASESLAGAQERVRGGGVADLFPAHGVLLVVKGEGGPRDAAHV